LNLIGEILYQKEININQMATDSYYGEKEQEINQIERHIEELERRIAKKPDKKPESREGFILSVLLDLIASERNNFLLSIGSRKGRFGVNAVGANKMMR